jgi:hypothetical protein
MIQSVDEQLLVTLISGVPWSHSGAGWSVLHWVKLVRSELLLACLACGSMLRANHWAGPGISTPATEASHVASHFLCCRIAQGCTGRFWEGVPHHCSIELTLSRSCYRQHKDFSYAPSSSFYTFFTLLFMGVGSHPPLLLSSPCRLADLLPVDESYSYPWPATPQRFLELFEAQAMERL